MEKKYQVFVSSTYSDLKDERKEVSQAILESGCFPAGMELWAASNKKQWEVIKKVIDDCDYYLLIIAGKYGSVGTDKDGNKVSYTEMEFDYAHESGKPIIAMIHENPGDLSGKFTETKYIDELENFRNKAKDGRMIKYWNNKGELAKNVVLSLKTMMADPDATAVGWIKASDADIAAINERDFKDLQKKYEALSIDYSLLKADRNKLREKNAELDKKVLELESETDKLAEEVKNLKDLNKAVGDPLDEIMLDGESKKFLIKTKSGLILRAANNFLYKGLFLLFCNVKGISKYFFNTVFRKRQNDYNHFLS